MIARVVADFTYHSQMCRKFRTKVETKSEDPVESEPDADLSHWDRCSFGLGVGK